MHYLKVNTLLDILQEKEVPFEEEFRIEVNRNLLDQKARELLADAYKSLDGKGEFIILDKLKFDFKIDRFLFLYDDAVHFNRYRLSTLKTGIYDTFTFPWVEGYKRLCRTFEKECHKAGVQERVWNGPPVAGRCFGPSEDFGDLSNNGSAGWKLNAYNDAQYDLLSRLHGYKIIRISMYENLMTGGSLKKIDQLLTRPNQDLYNPIASWLLRKME
ncbi:hypothetical protein QWY93_16490 [Echinicola jeungdonensis]|uniref:Uncharacterized protein n=1 Tax=Echinicola jeungdonensis TaxID=709343 RepID=A0ABV5J6H2_9BACT|nr:hypothetical protein [Echinicola jeungdonensis]MDN3670917.1 hypothetical protein [Echinicola jeungdonensis]